MGNDGTGETGEGGVDFRLTLLLLREKWGDGGILANHERVLECGDGGRRDRRGTGTRLCFHLLATGGDPSLDGGLRDSAGGDRSNEVFSVTLSSRRSVRPDLDSTPLYAAGGGVIPLNSIRNTPFSASWNFPFFRF